MRTERPSLLQFESPWWFLPGVVRVARPPGCSSAEEARRRLLNNELKQPYIMETPFERRLHFSLAAVQSAMSLEEPHALILPYTRKMMTFLLFKPNPKHVVMLGLGGGSLPKFCHRHLPQTQITVVEIDADVIALRDEFCVPRNDRRFRIVHDDGEHYLSRLATPVDVILIDAFDRTGAAPALENPDFYVQAAECLSLNGVFAINLAGERADCLPYIRLIRATFGGSTLILPTLADDNLLVFAFKTGSVRPTAAKYVSRARRLQARLSLEFPRYLRRMHQGHIVP
jgi:spermidine synthase